MSQVVLDASAVLAMMLKEPGADCVIAALDRPQPISAVNWSEVAFKYLVQGANQDEILFWLHGLSLRVIAFDQALGQAAACMATATKTFDLSFADRACLATAQALHLPVLTADRRWSALKLGIEVRLIR